MVKVLIFCIGTVDSYAYKQAIDYYLDDIKRLSPHGSTLCFQQDNAASHISEEITELLRHVKSLKFWSPNSPQIIPIKKVWSFKIRKLEGKKFNDLEQFKKEVLFI